MWQEWGSSNTMREPTFSLLRSTHLKLLTLKVLINIKDELLQHASRTPRAGQTP